MAETPEAVTEVQDDPRFRAGSEEYQLGEDEDQQLLDFGNDLGAEPADPEQEPVIAEATPSPEPETASKEEPVAKEVPEVPAEEPQPAETPTPEAETSIPEPEKPRNPMIPRARFDEVNQRYRQTRQELDELRARLNAREAQPAPAKPSIDLDAKEAEYMDAVLDGDREKALSIRREIREAEMQSVPQPTQNTPTVSEIKAALKFDETVAEMNKLYPVFDPQSDDHDADLTDEAVVLSQGFQRRGMAPDAALRKAVKYVVEANGIEAAGVEPVALTDAKAQQPTAAAKPALPAKAVQNKLQTANKQPPKPASIVEREPSVDVDSMSLEEFEALPESTVRRLRGDML